MAWTGVSIAVYTGILVDIITETLLDRDEELQFELSMLAMVSLGVGEIVGAIGMGILVDIIGSKKACFINIALIALAAGSVILY